MLKDLLEQLPKEKSYIEECIQREYDKAVKVKDDAISARKKGERLLNQVKFNSVVFSSQGETFITRLEKVEKDSEREAPITKKIANFTLTYLYSFEFEEGLYSNYFKLDDQIIRLAAAEVQKKEKLESAITLQVPWALVLGEKRDLKVWFSQIMRKKVIKYVKPINYIGFVPEQEKWVFPELGYDGVHHELRIPNEMNLLDFGRTIYKPTFVDADPGSEFRFNLENHDFNWFSDFWGAYGPRGVITLAYFTLSLFSNQIRSELGFFPFLELTGVPSSGKTSLVKWIWQLFGRADYEGIPIQKTNEKAVDRIFGQLSGLPMVLIEGDKGEGYDFDILKPLFNGGTLRVRAKRTEDLATYSPKFRSSIVVAQNRPIRGHEATMSRFCQVYFNSIPTPNQETHFERLLDTYTATELSSYLLEIITDHRISHMSFKTIEDRCDFMFKHGYSPMFLNNWRKFNKKKIKELKHNRVREVYTCVLSGVEALVESILKNSDERELVISQCRGFLIKSGQRRQEEMRIEPEDLRLMWQYFDEYPEQLDHHQTNDHYLAINLVQFNVFLGEQKLKQINIDKVKQFIVGGESKTYKFMGYKTIRSKVQHKTIKAYVFARPKEEIDERRDNEKAKTEAGEYRNEEFRQETVA